MAPGSAKLFVIASNINPDENEVLSAEQQAALVASRGGDFIYAYYYGFRKIGDSIIDLQRESKQWTLPQDVDLIVQFRADEGQYVAHVEIKIDQSSIDHDATIIGGGIGKDHIRILVKAKNTYWFKYEARVYGRKILGDH